MTSPSCTRRGPRSNCHSTPFRRGRSGRARPIPLWGRRLGPVLHGGVEAGVLAGDAASAAERRRKIARIQAIRAAGHEPQISFARIPIPNEREAFLVEAALIDG